MLNNYYRKGIILAAGLGTRLKPLTNVFSKHFLNIYNKPMIYYPLTTLMSLKVREILIITNQENYNLYFKLLKHGRHLGINIDYEIQNKPNGIAESLKIGKKFLQNKPSVLILGDNLLFGKNILKTLKEAYLKSNSTIFTVKVKNPDSFGVLYKKNNKFQIIEKPKKYLSNKAVIGLYFFDKFAPYFASKLKKSKRGELEITDLNNFYLNKKKLDIVNLEKNTHWIDTGNFEDLLYASKIIEKYEKKFNIIGSPELEAYRNKWINLKKLKSIANNYNNQYGFALKTNYKFKNFL